MHQAQQNTSLALYLESGVEFAGSMFDLFKHGMIYTIDLPKCKKIMSYRSHILYIKIITQNLDKSVMLRL